MADRVVIIEKRRTILKGQITSLRGSISRRELDPKNVQHRFKRLTERFHEFEDLQVELETIAESGENARHYEEVQNSYYELCTMVDDMQPAGNSAANDNTRIANSFANSTTIERQKAVKLPIADLPKFDGDYDKWLSFKNSFKVMIDARTDIDDLNKFIYLRNCLTGSASQKLALLDASTENYKKGWDTLVKLYEKKRLLISKHYAAIFDNGYCKITPLQSNSTSALTKVFDDTQQHLSMLKSLEVTPDESMIVCFLERMLPDDVRNEWERTLKLDSTPKFADLYDFVHEYLSRQITINRESARSRSTSNKRPNDKAAQFSKAKRSNSGTRALITNITNACGYCGQNHFIFQCTEFEKLNVSQRWEAARAKKLCFNCLREHKKPCKSSHCKKCEKYHNTLLHSDKRNDSKSINIAKGGIGAIDKTQ